MPRERVDARRDLGPVSLSDLVCIRALLRRPHHLERIDVTEVGNAVAHAELDLRAGGRCPSEVRPHLVHGSEEERRA